MDVTPLWWALVIGVGLGGNSTPLGVTANIFCVSELERAGIAEAQVSPRGWLRTGIPATFVSLLVATTAFIVVFVRL